MKLPVFFGNILITFTGYLLITTGVYFLYLMLFKRDRLPHIFSKVWLIIVVSLGAAALIVFGWLLVVSQ